MHQSLTRLDSDKRQRQTALATASEAVFDDYILPLYYEHVINGVQRHLQMKIRFDGYTLAQEIHTK